MSGEEPIRPYMIDTARDGSAVRLAADLLDGDATAAMTWGVIQRERKDGWKA